MALSPSERRALTRRYQSQLAGVSARTLPAVESAWKALGGFRDDDLPGFIQATTPATTAAKTAATALAAAYVSTILATASPAVAAVDVPVQFNALSSFLAVRKALADGHPYADAVRIGQSQAEAAVRNLTISTARQAGDLVVSRSKVQITGWRRVAESDACPWCLNLDGAHFPTSSAADFGHDRCHCTPEPIAA